ncbi:glutathione S-transferase [Raphidocelis subcapitata]|uniref:Glutathione S-transferase n=1 Tax=Raphidocelis subcapitata TaxID=307507 RepID=A0A2V0NYY2_9CHLO|nr:glutathione S-transferase [Raphidocelis subcapitata]|eukprot:GBF92826.1 glutathione S-transferase [Raphidocelis subcapitata]
MLRSHGSRAGSASATRTLARASASLPLAARRRPSGGAARRGAAPRGRVVPAAGDLGSMLNSLFRQGGGGGGGGAAAAAAAPRRALAFSDNAPSWEQLAEMVAAREKELGVNFTNPDYENGPTHPLALKRTFGSTEPIRVKLYRDHAAWCPYCQKVWLQLEEKRIPYVIEKINMRCYGDKPASFLSKVPSGLLPVLELDGRVVTESGVIMQLLEDSFPDHSPLLPPKGAPQRDRADALMRLERRFFGSWLDWLCSGWNQPASQAGFERTLDAVAEALEASGGPYFLGPELSLVDCTFAPMLERASSSLAYYKGFFMRGQGRWPAIDRWFEAMESRPTYLGTRSDHYTHCHDLPPQLGGCYMTPAGEPIAAAIDGGAWRLPLPPLGPTSLPEPYSPGDNPPLDRLEAAARMVSNHAALVRFALRGPGRPGARPVSAPLADPSAVAAADPAAAAAADAALRHVAHALLVGPEAKQQSGAHALAASEAGARGGGGALDGSPAVAAADYLRDRVGVPRDMKLPAAQQLRAHLTWLIDELAA